MSEIKTGKVSDAEIIKWLYDNLEYDGWGYWFPEVCVKEVCFQDDGPSLEEYRKYMCDRVRKAKEHREKAKQRP
jgi:hypothetical protein